MKRLWLLSISLLLMVTVFSITLSAEANSELGLEKPNPQTLIYGNPGGH